MQNFAPRGLSAEQLWQRIDLPAYAPASLFYHHAVEANNRRLCKLLKPVASPKEGPNPPECFIETAPLASPGVRQSDNRRADGSSARIPVSRRMTWRAAFDLLFAKVARPPTGPSELCRHRLVHHFLYPGREPRDLCGPMSRIFDKLDQQPLPEL